MMNVKILEFAKQTGLCDEDGDFFGDKTSQTMLFAELIIRECADLFEVEWGDEKLTGNDVGYVLKKHFGVER